MGQVAAIERKNIANRLHSGREIAKANGVHFGRKQGQIIKTHEDKEREYSKVLRDLRQGLSVAKVAKIHSVSESTVKRLKKIRVYNGTCLKITVQAKIVRISYIAVSLASCLMAFCIICAKKFGKSKTFCKFAKTYPP